MTMAIKIGTFGDDTVNGTAANDYLFGLGGDDTVYGRGGNDIIHGGAGDDFLYGGRGNDTAVFDTATDVTISLLGYATADSSGLGTDYLSNIENITTGDGDDTIDGNNLANVLTAAAGNDEIDAYGGDDVLLGGTGIDDLDGGNGDDEFDGGADDDWLTGDAGNDVLNGGSGDDELNGDDWSGDAGLGVDILTGGDGADTLAFHVGQSGLKLGQRDIITDFDAGEADRIRLHGFDDLEFIGTDAFSAANQVRYVQKAAVTFVQVNSDADLIADMAIELTGSIALQASDFLFY